MVCGVRNDAFGDCLELGLPLTTRNVFRVNNLTVEEAKAVIVECAGLDGLEIAPAFAETLASDLEADGMVRPPELQLVCRHLKGGLNEKSYRKEGGAAGILANHVKVAARELPETNKRQRACSDRCATSRAGDAASRARRNSDRAKSKV